MASLIIVYNSDGLVGRCDAKCTGAKPGSKCDCCCGGVNHGVGVARALLNVGEALQNAERWAVDKRAPDGLPLFVAAQLGFVVGDML